MSAMLKNYHVTDIGGTHLRVGSFPVGRQIPSAHQQIGMVEQEQSLEQLIHLLAALGDEARLMGAIALAQDLATGKP